MTPRTPEQELRGFAFELEEAPLPGCDSPSDLSVNFASDMDMNIRPDMAVNCPS